MKTQKLMAFDLEIAKVVPEGEDLRDHRPLGISCAAAWASDEPTPGPTWLWWGQGRPDGRPWDKMPAAQVRTIVLWLAHMVADEGYMLVTWNGLGFDFSVLAEESGLHQVCVKLAWGHYDPMWHFFCEKGYAVGLDGAARGMGVGAKVEGMNGAKAPVLWQEGWYDEVLAYCAQDARLTLELFQATQKMGGLCWRDKRDQSHTWFAASGRMLPAHEAVKLPLPSPPEWIKDPWPREHFTAWMRGGGHYA